MKSLCRRRKSLNRVEKKYQELSETARIGTDGFGRQPTRFPLLNEKDLPDRREQRLSGAVEDLKTLKGWN